MNSSPGDLNALVAALPEIYQPIYGHPEFSESATRECEDRLQQIAAVHDALARQLQRPVRVLDLGCAHGWFSLSLAQKGAHVIGIDYLAANINVCNALARENTGLKIRFSLMEIERIPSQLKPDQFDIVMGLSVFHHLCYRNGKKWTRNFLGAIFEKIPVALLEMALATEPTKLAVPQPENPEYLIEQMPFVQILSYYSRHVTCERPLYFCSNRYWYLGGELAEFSNWHDNGSGRRYFFAEYRMAKICRTTGKTGVSNQRSITNEINFLTSPPEGCNWCPEILQSGATEDKTWLVRQKLPGTTLSDMILGGQYYDERIVLEGVLSQLVGLEKNSLFHPDVCAWNVIIGDNSRPTLIDYSEIFRCEDTKSMVSPFPAFLIFARQTVTRRLFETEATRWPFISPRNFPEPYLSWGLRILQRPFKEWSFAFLSEALKELPVQEQGKQSA